ncbi:fumarylacetoacetate hydrolase family protein [Pollutibacter soli]|uniref:fumarylacetoacetate hydrolase family protein n=1 Tax=Pollutibacter soli TaxID=3034157 RepID=UPI003013D17F
MKLYRTSSSILIEHEGQYYESNADWDEFVNREGLFAWLKEKLASFKPSVAPEPDTSFLPPIQSQEIWAAGVTYFRSRTARMEESKDAGGGTFYDKVYHAERPEIFFKALAHRTTGHRGKIRIRRDSAWDVPEPELTLFMSSAGTIEGYTVGNDVSSRSIEGENPLYLPQAKSYQYSAALGPCLLVKERVIPRDATIRLHIIRKGQDMFDGNITIDQMKRSHEELVEFLFRESDFPYGAYLMTGTGIVPPDSFTLQEGDEVRISITGIGTLISFTEKK